MTRVGTIVLVLAAAGIVTGCSGHDLKRSGHAVGNQHACMAANEAHPYESLRDLECMGAQPDAAKSFEAYEAARAAALDDA